MTDLDSPGRQRGSGHIRSFVIRAGRMTPAQQRALDELGALYGVPARGELDFDQLFGRRAPCTVEVGTGNGDALLSLAEAHPEQDFVGLEVHPPGVGRLLAGAESRGLTNLRVIRDDAVQVFLERIPGASLARVNIWFPDPWPKKRHHKRRIVQPEFVDRLCECLQPGGLLHLATDWQEYAEHMLEVLRAEPRLSNIAAGGAYSDDLMGRPETHFERRGRRLGHGTWDLVFRRL